MRRVVIVGGATGSGKSDFALELALACEGVILNADALQLYRELRVLSARPTRAQEALVPHRLYGIWGGEDPRPTAARWAQVCAQEVRTVWEEGRVPIVVGGCGFYLETLMQGLSPLPEIPEIVRSRLKERLQKEGLGSLRQELEAQDPETASKLSPQDTQRTLRALEVVETTGYPLSYWQKKPLCPLLPEAFFERKVISLSPSVLHERLKARSEKMWAEGALEEVRLLAPRPQDPTHPLEKALGVREIRSFLTGEKTEEAAKEDFFRSTKHYAKRQGTWFRRWAGHECISFS